MHWNWDVANFIAQALGAIGTIAAILIAVNAQAAIGRERRRAFELEILREILAEVEDGEFLDDIAFTPARLRRYQRRLMLLRQKPEHWEMVMSANYYDEVAPKVLDLQRALSRKHAELVGRLAADPGNKDLLAEDLRVRQELSDVAQQVRVGVPRKLINALERSIQERVDARDSWWRWWG